MTIITLYHGTDIESALDILNNGLSREKLISGQGKYLQSGVGWYTAVEPDVAWFFATLAAEAFESCTVIEMLISEELLDELFTSKLAHRERIGNVPFEGEQIWFALEALDILNQEAHFIPHAEVEE